MKPVVFEAKNLKKYFGGVKAVDGISLEVKEGDIIGLVGENGAGKSTLMKLLVGEYTRDSGDVIFDGKTVFWKDCFESLKDGVGLIHQRPALVPELTGAQNIFLGREFTNFGVVDNNKILKESKKILNKYPIKENLNLDKLVSEMTAGEREIIDILKVLSLNPKILILDEPSASLTEDESRILMDIIKDLNENKKVSIIFISHKLEEIFSLCKSIVVLRNGKNVGQVEKENFNKDLIISMIINKSLDEYYPPKTGRGDGSSVELNEVNTENIHDISIKANKGEIVGFYGLSGAGMTDVLETIFGVQKLKSGTINFDNEVFENNSIKKAIKNRVFLIPEDRDKKGLISTFSVGENITLSHINKLIKKVFFSKKTEKPVIEKGIKNFKVSCGSPDLKIGALSGGNQQKVVIAKWLYEECNILMLDDPTVGIDIGTKREIYLKMRELTNQGKTVLLVSSEIQEIIGMSDRIYTMKEGRITNEIIGKDINQETILKNVM